MANEVIRFIRDQNVQLRIEELLKDRAPQFVTSLSSVLNSSPKLAMCKPETVLNAALKAAALNLPIENNLGFAYIIPYDNKHSRTMEAQFQLGYKGYIQLAQRSSQYRTIGTAIVYDGQLTNEDPLRGNSYNWKAKKSDTVIGYVCLFALINGFEKSLYMSRAEMEAHARRYSKAYAYDIKVKKKTSLWSTDFDMMALKTTIRLLVPKYGPMSVEMQEAVRVDQAIIRDDETVYVDNDELSLADVGANEDKKKAIVAAHAKEAKDGNADSPQRDNGVRDSGPTAPEQETATEDNPAEDGGGETEPSKPDTKPAAPPETVREKAERKYVHPQTELVENEAQENATDNRSTSNPGNL